MLIGYLCIIPASDASASLPTSIVYVITMIPCLCVLYYKNKAINTHIIIMANFNSKYSCPPLDIKKITPVLHKVTLQ